jgi:large subunit ribosomal protein L21
MYAVVETGGKQYKVKPGDILDVDRLPGDKGQALVLDKVVMLAAESGPQVGTPYVSGVAVQALIVGQVHGPRIDAFKYKPKKRYRRQWGHRQPMTRLHIESIQSGSEVISNGA